MLDVVAVVFCAPEPSYVIPLLRDLDNVLYNFGVDGAPAMDTSHSLRAACVERRRTLSGIHTLTYFVHVRCQF